jgi:hypothetical protein
MWAIGKVIAALVDATGIITPIPVVHRGSPFRSGSAGVCTPAVLEKLIFRIHLPLVEAGDSFSVKFEISN